jgi:hypothetical protein
MSRGGGAWRSRWPYWNLEGPAPRWEFWSMTKQMTALGLFLHCWVWVKFKPICKMKKWWIKNHMYKSPQGKWNGPHASFIFVCFVFWDRVLLCIPSWPQTLHAPNSACQMLGSQLCTTVPGYLRPPIKVNSILPFCVAWRPAGVGGSVEKHKVLCARGLLHLYRGKVLRLCAHESLCSLLLTRKRLPICRSIA